MEQRPEMFKFSEEYVAKNFGTNYYNNDADMDTGIEEIDDMPEPSIFETFGDENEDPIKWTFREKFS